VIKLEKIILLALLTVNHVRDLFAASRHLLWHKILRYRCYNCRLQGIWLHLCSRTHRQWQTFNMTTIPIT